jgi:hypothetical protein
MQTLDWNSVTSYVLFKHHLLDDSRAKKVLQVVDDIIALHATSATTPYLSLCARVNNFRKEHLDQELYQRRSLVRLEAMRRTLFITSTDLAPILCQATKTPDSYRLKRLQRWGVDKPEYERLTTKLYNILKKGRKTLPEIKRALPKKTVRSVQLTVGKARYDGTNINIALSSMVRDGVVVSEKDGGASSKLGTRASCYMLFEEAYPNLDLHLITVEEAKVSLLRRYIRSFGPVATQDMAWWTGFSSADVERSLSAIEGQLSLVRISGFNRDYWMLRSDLKQYRMFRAFKGKSVILLPYEDPYTKGYKGRDRLIDPDREREAYATGEVQPTILSNGKIVGTWTRGLRDSKVVQLTFFKKPKRTVEREAVQKAKAMARLISRREPRVQINIES